MHPLAVSDYVEMFRVHGDIHSFLYTGSPAMHSHVLALVVQVGPMCCLPGGRLHGVATGWLWGGWGEDSWGWYCLVSLPSLAPLAGRSVVLS